MALENKIKNGIKVVICALMLYGANYCYHGSKSSSYRWQIISKNIEKYVYVENSQAKSFGEFCKDLDNFEREIEELTQKRELHEKRRFNPFYKVFSK